MKAILRQFLFGLLGGSLLTTVLSVPSASALSESELLEKLAAVSVYVVTDRNTYLHSVGLKVKCFLNLVQILSVVSQSIL